MSPTEIVPRLRLIRGYLGWGNATPPDGRASSLQLWGPEGRWGGGTHGHYIEDAMEAVGCGEGTEVVVVALPRPLTQPEADSLVDLVRAALEDTDGQ